MKRASFLPVICFILITLIFFYPIFKGFIPFPGDLLVSTPPYSSESFLGYAPGGVPNKAQGSDVMRESMPWKFFAMTSFKKGEIPFWTPYNFSGNPLLANFQSAVLYPLNVVFFIVPFLDAWTIFIALSPLLAGVFTFLFLRLRKLSQAAGIFGGVVFAFSSYMVVWLEWGNITHTLLWLPLALFFTEKYRLKAKWHYVVGLIASLWFSFLAGYIQEFFYLISVVAIYYFAFEFGVLKKSLPKAGVFIISLIFPVLLSLFQLLPTLALLAISSRNNYSLTQITTLLNPWWYTITMYIPDFFGNPAARNFWFVGTYIERVSYFGVIPFLLASSVFFSKRKDIMIFSSIFVVCFLLSLDLFGVKYLYLLPLPMLSTTVPTRILGILCFSGAVLSAYGLDALREGISKKRFFLSILLGGFLLSIAWVFVFFGSHFFTKISPESVAVTEHNLIIPTFLSFIFVVAVVIRFSTLFRKIPRSATLIVICLLVITLADLFYFFHKITPFAPREFVYPTTPVISYLQEHAGINRFWGYGSAYISSNFQTFDRTFSPEGDDPLHTKIYTEFIAASSDGKLPVVASRLDANLKGGYGPTDLRNNFYRERVMAILGVKYILNKDDLLETSLQPDTTTFPSEKYRLVWQQAPWQVYENLSALPRVFLSNDYRVISDKKALSARLFDHDFDPSQTILLEKDPHLSKNSLTQKSVSIISYSPNRVVLEAALSGDALLFLSDTYTPDWTVTIDGRNATVYKADYAFRAVPVGKGRHTVIFSYYPKSFDWGWKLSLVALIIMLGGIGILRKKKLLV